MNNNTIQSRIAGTVASSSLVLGAVAGIGLSASSAQAAALLPSGGFSWDGVIKNLAGNVGQDPLTIAFTQISDVDNDGIAIDFQDDYPTNIPSSLTLVNPIDATPLVDGDMAYFYESSGEFSIIFEDVLATTVEQGVKTSDLTWIVPSGTTFRVEASSNVSLGTLTLVDESKPYIMFDGDDQSLPRTVGDTTFFFDPDREDDGRFSALTFNQIIGNNSGTYSATFRQNYSDVEEVQATPEPATLLGLLAVSSVGLFTRKRNQN